MPEKCPKTPLHEHTTQIPLRGKIIQDFIKALDRHAAFKILLRLDASFAMSHVPSMPSGCTGRTSGFEAQTAKPAYMVVLISSVLTRVQTPPSATTPSKSFALPRTGILVELAIAFLWT
jgi:hypothetical protein